MIPIPSSSAILMKRSMRSSNVLARMMTIKSRNWSQLRNPLRLRSILLKILYANSSLNMNIYIYIGYILGKYNLVYPIPECLEVYPMLGIIDYVPLRCDLLQRREQDVRLVQLMPREVGLLEQLRNVLDEELPIQMVDLVDLQSLGL
jgi:hypothetical protein